MKPGAKWVIRLGFGLVAVIVACLMLKDWILRGFIEKKIRSETGMVAQVGRVSMGMFSSAVAIRDLKLYNSAEFGGVPFAEVPELDVKWDAAALRQHTLHVTFMRFNLRELDVVRNSGGQTNIAPLVRAIQTRVLNGQSRAHAPGQFQFAGIDVLEFTFDRARYVDLADASRNRNMEVNLENQVFKNVKSMNDLQGILAMAWLRSGGSFSFRQTGR